MTKIEQLLASVTLSADVVCDNAYVQVTLGDQPEGEQTVVGFEQAETVQPAPRQAV